MVTRIRLLKEFSSEGKPLIVGLPGMGRVGYVSVNYFLSKNKGDLVAELYSTSFPPHLIVGKDGISSLFIGKLYDLGDFMIFTAETQPQSPDGQNEVCDSLLEFLTKRGTPRSVIAAAAYVVPEVNEKRRVYVTGNDEALLKTLTGLGGVRLNDGVIMGINGAIVGWAQYYGIQGAVVLGETWSAIVEFDETDFRAAIEVINLLGKYLGKSVDTSPLEGLMLTVEAKIQSALDTMARMVQKEEKPRKEVL
ncbi:MAG: hypothetical protein DRO10_01140 [Thermoprotei archaeon]|nr:MAG: hypothetical protein DRO10_01140 [Thermoprotei archaeon]